MIFDWNLGLQRSYYTSTLWIFLRENQVALICILSMDRPAVGLRLPILPILIAAFWTVMSGRQLQTFIPAMSEEKDNSNMIWLVSFHTFPFPVDTGILDPLTNADNPFPSIDATYSIESKM